MRSLAVIMSPRTRRVATRAGLLSALVLLGGCESSWRELDQPATLPIEAQKLHPISADIQRASFEIGEAHRFDVAQSSTYFDVTRFVRHYRRDGRGPFEVDVPRKPSSSLQRNIASVRRIAERNGIPSHRISVRQRTDGAQSVTLSFMRIAAVAPEHCNHWNENAIKRVETRPLPIFGCASQRNLANMVSDPTDLVTPQVEEPRGSERRAATAKSYRDSGGPAPVLLAK